MGSTTLSRAEKLDSIFGTPLFAVLLAILCNVLWGSAFPFIKLGYRLFAIDAADTASILCFAGVRFMLGSVLVLGGSLLLEGRLPTLPKGQGPGRVLCTGPVADHRCSMPFSTCAVALLTGAFGGILNSTQSFLGVIFAHFLYGKADRMTPAKTLGCGVGFAGVLIGTLGNHGGGSGWGVFCMLHGHRRFHPGRPVEQIRHPQGRQLCRLLCEPVRGRCGPVPAGHGSGRAAGTLRSALGVLVLLSLAFICGAGYHRSGPC